MSDSSSSHQGAPSTGGGDPPALSYVESPGIAPGSPHTSEAAKAEAAKPEAASPQPATWHNGADHQPKPFDAKSAYAHGTALILAPARPRAKAPELEPEPAPVKP